MADNSVQSEPESGGENRGAALGAAHFNLIRQQAERGFIVRAPERAAAVDCCTLAINDSKRPWRTRLAAVRALAQLVGIDQRDLHHIERMQHESGILDLRMRRAEEGKPNDCVAVQVTPVRELPLPESLREARKRILEPTGN